jgi:hypothetical protein
MRPRAPESQTIVLAHQTLNEFAGNGLMEYRMDPHGHVYGFKIVDPITRNTIATYNSYAAPIVSYLYPAGHSPRVSRFTVSQNAGLRDLVPTILKYVNPYDLLRLRLVNRYWNALISTRADIWERPLRKISNIVSNLIHPSQYVSLWHNEPPFRQFIKWAAVGRSDAGYAQTVFDKKYLPLIILMLATYEYRGRLNTVNMGWIVASSSELSFVYNKRENHSVQIRSKERQIICSKTPGMPIPLEALRQKHYQTIKTLLS